MRIGVISDLHVDLNGPLSGSDSVVHQLCQTVQRSNIQVLIVAGDVSNRYDLTLESLARIQEGIDCRCLFVPGNHDLWNDASTSPPRPLGETWKSWDSYEALLAFPGNLCRGPVQLPGGWTVVGEAGWYDYAFGHPRFSVEEFDRMRFAERLWQDKVNAIWDRPTREMHACFRDRLAARLQAVRPGALCEGGAAGRRVEAEGGLIVVTHVVSHRAFTVQRPSPLWEYLNAFLGSPEYGELAVRHGAACAVCGHVHYRRQAREGPTRFICSCLGYATEWPDPRDVAGEVGRSLFVLNLDGEL
jgi:putative phosphoesterase